MALVLTPKQALHSPTSYQQEVLASNAKMKVLLNGRQSGKSTVIRALLYKDAWEEPNRELLYVAKSIKQAKDIMWNSLTKGYDPIFPKEACKEVNNVDHYIVLVNGTRITVTGSENVDGLLGKTCDKLYIDEWQSHSNQEYVWTLLQPMVAARQGDVVFAGTARGYDDLWEKCQYGLPGSAQKKAGWRSWHIPTRLSGTPAGTPEALALAKSTLSPQQYQQEYEASPTATVGLVYPDFDQDINIVRNLTLNPIIDGEKTEPTLHIGMDFNVDNMMAVVGIVVNKTEKGKPLKELHIVDEIHLTYNSTTQSMVQEIKRRYPKRNLIIYPDGTGGNSHAATGSSNFDVLRNEGWHLKYLRGRKGDGKGYNPAIVDRVNVVNSVIKNAVGQIRLKIHPQCKNIIKTLTRQTYKNGKPDKDTGLDHAGDALGYLIYQLYKPSGGVTITTF